MFKALLYALVIVIVGIFSFSAGELKNERETRIVNERVSVVESTTPDSVEALPFTTVVERVLPTVVGISAVERNSGVVTESLGSGVILSDMGYIVTNQHVVGDSPVRIDVTMFDGSIKKGEIVWSDKALDLAVVKISGTVLNVAEFGDSEALKVGEDVFAIGNPLSLQFERSVTKGIISALNRTITINGENSVLYMEDLIQTDASINPGNSGGPLMNSKGEVVGINTIRVQSAEGMGFAVPVNICESVITQLETTGEFKTPYLGLYAFTSQTAKYLKKESGDIDGLFVVSLDVNGPAYKSGLRYGDIIQQINGREINTMISLREELFKAGANSTVVLGVVSGSVKKEIEVKCGEMKKLYVGVNQ